MSKNRVINIKVDLPFTFMLEKNIDELRNNLDSNNTSGKREI